MSSVNANEVPVVPVVPEGACLAAIKAISFDLDDTLWHCSPAISRANEALYRWFERNTPLITAVHTPESLQQYQAIAREESPELHDCVTAVRVAGLKKLLREFAYAESLASDAFDVFYRARSEVELYDGVELVLKQLKSTYRLAAITNGNADLELIGIAHYFDVVYAADLNNPPKPAADMFHHCLADLKLPASALLHIGDNPVTDVGGGYEAGIQTLWFNQYNKAWPEHLPRPHFQAQSLSDVAALLVS